MNLEIIIIIILHKLYADMILLVDLDPSLKTPGIW